MEDVSCHIFWYRARSDKFREREWHIREDEDEAMVLVVEGRG